MKLQLIYIPIIALLALSSCMKGAPVDTVIHNGKVHTMLDDGKDYEAIAIKDGKIIEVGPERQILNKYSADEYIDAGQKDVYPGWTDAHGHILSYARQMISVDLVGCESYDEMLVKIEKYQGKHDRPFIIGRGWDQSLWGEDEMPNNERLNALFPDIPVCLFRIDGHALLANDYLINKSDVFNKFYADEELHSGGYYESESEFTDFVHGRHTSAYHLVEKPTGVFVDNAMNPILDILPDFPKKELKQAILEIQNELYSYGITGVHEAGLTHTEVDILLELIDKDKLDLNIYGMLLPTEENIAFAKKNGHFKKDNLYIRSFKVYGDGALGSRGACLKRAYTDKHDHHGYLTTSVRRMQDIAAMCIETNYQMNTHAIGDSTNKVILDLYQDVYMDQPDHRWRIEHAQVVDPADYELFAKAGIFPSVQPTHATSDQRWAHSRLGKERMEGAYAYRSLLDQFGMIAIGTDFPVEYTDPFKTIHSAVQRMNSENIPGGGFMASEAITLEECIKGMTIWAAYASFQEDQIGTIEKGKDATITIFEGPVITSEVYQPNFAYMTFINGKKVYSVE